MLQAFTHTPDAKVDPKNPPYLKALQLDSLSTGDFQQNNYTRYSENSQFSQISHNSQGSFFTPGDNSSKKKPILDDITNLLMNVHPKKLDFSSGLDTTSSKSMTPNYPLRKLEQDYLKTTGRLTREEHIEQTKPFHMEIEDLDFVVDNNSGAIEPEKPEMEESQHGSTMMDEVIQNMSHNDAWRRGRISKNNSNEIGETKHKTPSLIKRWKKSDKIFEGKYSTGATPKFSKNSPSHLPLIPFKRCNTDVPPTFESDKQLMIGDKTEIGVNKYITNLMGTSDINKPRGQSFAGTETLLKQPQLKPLVTVARQKSSVLLPTQNFVTQNNKPKLLRDFPLSSLNFTQNSNLNTKLNNKQEQGLFLIPEKNIEYDSTIHTNKTNQNNFDPKPEPPKTKKKENDFVSKLLTFEEDDGAIDEEEEINNENIDINAIKTPVLQPQYGRQDEQDNDLFGRQTFTLNQNLPQSNNLTSPVAKVFNTPTKKSPFHINFSLLESVTGKKEAHSKLFPKGFDSSDKIRPFEFENRGGYDDVISEGDDSHNGRSRFEVDYEVLEVLGSGHFGTVYKCQNKLDGLIYAVKCTKNKLKGQSNINQALNEAQALASLSALGENPFIVRYYSAWIEDDRLYLAMEHCQSNLKTLRHQHIRFSESMIRQIMRNICMGLRHLHNQKIVHLDIKPENILYSKTNKFKIADLGLSRIALRSNHEDINEGDCRYLAPELLRDYPDHELPDLTKADIFSFGATIYELITGSDLPRNGLEWSNLRAGNLNKLDHLNYSNSLKSMLRSMMDSNPDLRPTANELLNNYLQSEIELELKWEKRENKLLKDKVKELEKKLNACKACKAKRKNSI